MTAITGDVQRNVDFYVSVLGLRFVKQTVNFDVPDTYHVYFGDRLGSPGTAMTFFGWPHLQWRPQGAGQVAAAVFAVPERSLGYWQQRLTRLGVEVRRAERFGAGTLLLHDPDRIALELAGVAGEEGGDPWTGGAVPLEHAIRGFHSVVLAVADAEPSARLLTGVMGFGASGEEGGRMRFQSVEGGPGGVVDLVSVPGQARGEEGTGTVHHVAWRARDDAHQLAWREVLVGAGFGVTPVIDRKYFHSIYFREPGGVLFEIATDGPGFTVDEDSESLGSALQLPSWHEEARPSLERTLPALRPPLARVP